MTEQEYQVAIPKHCFYQTVQEHIDCLMLCWGLAASIKGKYEMKCCNCELIVQSGVKNAQV